jgi:hypothetical protein
VRLVTRLPNALDNVRNLLLSRFFRHIDNHWISPELELFPDTRENL